MRYLFLVLIALILGSAAYTPADAQTNEDPTIHVEINKGQMVRLSRAASSVIVADPAIADIQVVSPRMIYVNGKAVGETSLYAIDSNEATVLDATVEVSHNLSRMNRVIKEAVPDADVQLKSVNGGLVINGFADSILESETVKNLVSGFLGKDQAVINMINTAGSDQVTLMVKVAEVSRNELKRFGIHMENFFSPGNFVFSIAQGRDFLNGNTLLRTGSDSSLYAAWTHGNFSLQSVIDALETQGLVSVLAEPSLTTTSGKTANFLAGGEFPIPMVDGDGNVTVEYKPFGISLNFTPVVMSKDKISLTVAPEVSTISTADSLQVGTSTTFLIPSLQTRRAQTTVELGSGQTFAVAGLFKNDRNNNINRFPGLGELPVLGALFRSQEFQNDQTELVILVTPYLVRPVAEQKLASPVEGYTPPNDLERLLLGKLYRETPLTNEEKTEINALSLQGDAGFILE